MATFDEVLLPPEIARGASIGPSYETIVTGPRTAEQRIVRWSNGLLVGVISYDTQRLPELALLNAFFRARKGKGRGFRFQDLTDYQATQEPLVNNGTTILQLIKTYGSGDEAEIRTIIKPYQVTIYQNGFALGAGAYTVDFTLGIVTLTTAAPGATFTWSGAFHVPVRFDTDKMQYEHLQVTYGQWRQVPLLELAPDVFSSGSETSGSGGIGSGVLTPGSVTVTQGSGSTANLSATAATGGSGAYTYQWQRAINGGAYTNLAGATGLTFADTTLSGGQSASYQLIVMDGVTSASSPQTPASWTMGTPMVVMMSM